MGSLVGVDWYTLGVPLVSRSSFTPVDPLVLGFDPFSERSLVRDRPPWLLPRGSSDPVVGVVRVRTSLPDSTSQAITYSIIAPGLGARMRISCFLSVSHTTRYPSLDTLSGLTNWSTLVRRSLLERLLCLDRWLFAVSDRGSSSRILWRDW